MKILYTQEILKIEFCFYIHSPVTLVSISQWFPNCDQTAKSALSGNLLRNAGS